VLVLGVGCSPPNQKEAVPAAAVAVAAAAAAEVGADSSSGRLGGRGFWGGHTHHQVERLVQLGEQIQLAEQAVLPSQATYPTHRQTGGKKSRVSHLHRVVHNKWTITYLEIVLSRTTGLDHSSGVSNKGYSCWETLYLAQYKYGLHTESLQLATSLPYRCPSDPRNPGSRHTHPDMS
jgi:hypothetical protein